MDPIDLLKTTLAKESKDLMRQYVMAIMATGPKRSQEGKKLLAANKISMVEAVFNYHLPVKHTNKDVKLFIKDVNHFVGTRKPNLLNKLLGFPIKL